MAKNRSKASGKISNGGRTKARLAQAAKREAKFAAKREAGKVYTYKKNPYEKGSVEYLREERERIEKNSDKRLPLVRLTSIMKKLDNRLAEKERREKEAREKKKYAKSNSARKDNKATA